MEHERHEQADAYRHRDVRPPCDDEWPLGTQTHSRLGTPRPAGVETSVLTYEDHRPESGHGSDDADQELNQRAPVNGRAPDSACVMMVVASIR